MLTQEQKESSLCVASVLLECVVTDETLPTIYMLAVYFIIKSWGFKQQGCLIQEQQQTVL
jgi:hypothetical protein